MQIPYLVLSYLANKLTVCNPIAHVVNLADTVVNLADRGQ